MKSQKAKPDKLKNTNHVPRFLILMPRKETLADRESGLIAFAAGIVWGLIVAKIMRVIYDKEKSKKENENTETAVDRK